MAFLDGQVEVYPRQFFAERADVEGAFDLVQAGSLRLGPGTPAVGERRAFHRFNHSKYIVTSGSHVKALSGINPVSTNATLASAR